MFCHTCHAEVPGGAAFCPACGARIPSAPVPRYCSECGAELEPDSQFCSSCGARADVGAVAEGSVGPDAEHGATTPPPPAQGGAGASQPDPFAYVEPAYPEEALAGFEVSDSSSPDPASSHSDPALDATRAVPVPPAEPASAAPTKSGPARRGRTVAIALGVVAAVALAGGGTWWYFESQHRAREAAEAEAERIATALHPVLIGASAPGWDTEKGASRLPVRVTGTGKSGETVDELQFVDSGGEGIELAQGSYELSVEASPIAADGTVYEVSGETIELSFTSDDATELIDATSQGGFSLTAIDALDVTDDVVSDAYDAALQDEDAAGVDAAGLKDAALARRDAAVQEHDAEQEQAARGVEAAGYRLTLPASWEGRVTVQVEAGVVRVYSRVCPRLEVCRVEVARGDAGGLGDVSAFTVSPSVSVGQGHYATVYVTNWGWKIAGYNLEGSSDPDDFFTMEEAREIVDLQTGGACTYDEVLEARSDGGGRDGAQAIQSFLASELVPTIEPL